MDKEQRDKLLADFETITARSAGEDGDRGEFLRRIVTSGAAERINKEIGDTIRAVIKDAKAAGRPGVRSEEILQGLTTLLVSTYISNALPMLKDSNSAEGVLKVSQLFMREGSKVIANAIALAAAAEASGVDTLDLIRKRVDQELAKDAVH